MKNKFIDSMKYLDAFYTTFKFDFLNPIKLEVWYDALSTIPENQLQQVVSAYCKTNQFPPQSPHSILDVYVTMVSNEITPDQAWEIVESNLHKGVSGYQTFSNGKVVYKNDFYTSIEKYPLIVETCKDMESSLRDVFTENKSYTKHEFKEAYKTKLQRSNNVLLLSGDSKLKIGG